jgi:hypothetical protein
MYFYSTQRLIFWAIKLGLSSLHSASVLVREVFHFQPLKTYPETYPDCWFNLPCGWQYPIFGCFRIQQPYFDGEKPTDLTG